MTGLPQGDAPYLLDTSYTITADITVPEGGAEGMIVTSGGRFAGFGFYLLEGKPVFLWNLLDLERLNGKAPRRSHPAATSWSSTSSMTAVGVGTMAYNNFSGIGKGGTGTLKVDGKVVATKKMEKTIPIILQWDESFDIGSDTITGVNDADYTPPFPLTAKFNKLTINDRSPAVVARGDQEARGRPEENGGRPRVDRV